MIFTELNSDEHFNLTWILKKFVEAVEKHGELCDDGYIEILVGDEDGNHDMLWVTPKEMAVMKKFIESDWI